MSEAYLYCEVSAPWLSWASTEYDPLVMTEEKALQRIAEAKSASRERFSSWAEIRSFLRGIQQVRRGEGVELTDADLPIDDDPPAPPEHKENL